MREPAAPTATSPQAYIPRETAISMGINTGLSMAFYAAVFGRIDPVPVWGLGKWVFDFVPQGFMIGLMSTLVPGAITARRLSRGEVARLAGRSLLPRALGWRAVVIALASAAVSAAAMAAIAFACGLQALPMIAAATIKVGWGALLALVVTPIGLRAALAAPADGLVR